MTDNKNSAEAEPGPLYAHTEPPLLIPAKVAAPLCGRSVATWWRDDAAGRIPAPIRRPGSTLWRRAELVAWVEANCPSRREWEARKR